MNDDPLDIPSFLRHAGNPKPPRARHSVSQRDWIMPPIALSAIARAVRSGCDTMQKLRKHTRGRYTDRQIREALHALVRSGDVARDGRRYRSQRTAAKP